MESKGFLFAVIPLAVIVIVFSYLNIKQEAVSTTVKIEEVSSCKTIEYNGKDRIDVVFISSDEDARRYSEVLLSTEPYKSYRDYFNTYVIDDVSPECEDYKGIAILCNTPEVQSISKRCPNDYIVVVKEKPLNIRSSSYGNVLSINKAHEYSVEIHEIGHAFGNLAEEYGGAKIPRGSKNCVSSCEKFKDPIDSCEVVCSESEFFRSIPEGVMRTLATSNYGVYNIGLLKKLLEKNKPEESSAITGRQIEDLSSCNQAITPIEISQTEDGTISAESTNIQETGCAPDNAGEGVLCVGSLCYPEVLFTDSQDLTLQEEIAGEVFTPEQTTTFYVEQDLSSPLIEITLNNEPIAIVNTAQAGATACLI